MDGQGCSDLPADVNGRSLDRIAGLEKIIAPELVEQAVLPLNEECVTNDNAEYTTTTTA